MKRNLAWFLALMVCTLELLVLVCSSSPYPAARAQAARASRAGAPGQSDVWRLLLPLVAKAWRPRPSATPTSTPTVTFTPTHTATATLTPTPSPTYPPQISSMTLQATSTELRVGEIVTLTARLTNEGVWLMGVPLYTLQGLGEPGSAVLTSLGPLQVYHSVPIYLGQYDEAQFVLKASSPGQATLCVRSSFEVHIGYPGPAFWWGDISPPLVITVSP